MTASTAPRRRPRSYVLFTAAVALLAHGCGTRSILGPVAEDAAVDATQLADRPDATILDAPRLDVAVLDVPRDTPDAGSFDAPSSDLPDVPAIPDIAVIADVADAPDVSAIVDTAIAADVPDASDVPALDGGAALPGILGSAARFTILAGSTVSNTGASLITGEVGVSPGLALVGIPVGTVVQAGTPAAALGQADTTAAYNYLAGLPCGTTLTGTDLGGRTLAPGVYCFTSSAMLTGTLVLDGQGQANPLFVFQVASTLVTSNAAAVLLINNARSCGVYWQTGSSATIGIGSNFSGNLVALGSVTLTTGVSLQGRALARTGAVTMDTNVVSNAACPDPAPPVGIDAGSVDASVDASVDRPDAAD